MVLGLGFRLMQLIFSPMVSPRLNISTAPLSHGENSALSRSQLNVAM
jgi:hypothetical protein